MQNLDSINRAHAISGLKEKIFAIECAKTKAQKQSYSFGCKEVDKAFGGDGLPGGMLHEWFIGNNGACLNILLRTLGEVAQKRGPIVWCQQENTLYTPAFLTYGLSPKDVVLVDVQNEAEAFWVFEQSLKCGQVGAVIGTFSFLSSAQGRKLQLKALDSGVTAFAMLKRFSPVSHAFARFKVTPLTSTRDDREVVKLELLRLRNGKAPQSWKLWFDEEKLCFYNIKEPAQKYAQSSLSLYAADIP